MLPDSGLFIFMTINITYLSFLAQNKLYRQGQIYLWLRLLSADNGGYFHMSSFDKISRKMRISSRTVKEYIFGGRGKTSLADLGWIYFEGKNWRIVSLHKINDKLSLETKRWTKMDDYDISCSFQTFHAYCVESYKSENIYLQYKRRSYKKYKDRSGQWVKRGKLASKGADYLNLRDKAVGEWSMRLSQKGLGLSLSTLHRLKKIAQKKGIARYKMTWVPEWDKLQIKTFEQLLNYVGRLEDREGLDLRRFRFFPKLGIYRLRDADIIFSNVAVFSR